MILVLITIGILGVIVAMMTFILDIWVWGCWYRHYSLRYYLWKQWKWIRRRLR